MYLHLNFNAHYENIFILFSLSRNSRTYLTYVKHKKNYTIKTLIFLIYLKYYYGISYKLYLMRQFNRLNVYYMNRIILSYYVVTLFLRVVQFIQ